MRKTQRETFCDIPNEELAEIIDNWIKSDKGREIMKRHLIDGIGFERLAEEHYYSVRWIKTIVYRNMDLIYNKIKGSE